MQFTTSTLALLFTSAIAAPFAQNAGTGNAFTNQCGISSFIPIAGNAALAPTLDSCYKLRDQAPSSGPWRIDRPKTLSIFGDCAFSAQPVNPGEVGYIGTADIHDLVEDAIKRWQTQTGSVGYYGTITKQVGAAGDMPCNSNGGQQVEIAWFIGHS